VLQTNAHRNPVLDCLLGHAKHVFDFDASGIGVADIVQCDGFDPLADQTERRVLQGFREPGKTHCEP
jgi:hypothetical protein